MRWLFGSEVALGLCSRSFLTGACNNVEIGNHANVSLICTPEYIGLVWFGFFFNSFSEKLRLFGLAFFWTAFLKSWLWEKLAVERSWWLESECLVRLCGEKLVVKIWVFGYTDSEIVDSDSKKRKQIKTPNQQVYYIKSNRVHYNITIDTFTY